MLSKVLILFIAALAFQTIDSVCVTEPTTTAAPVEIIPYHICRRSMNNWLLQNYSIALKCEGGVSNNKCSGSNAACNPDGGSAFACCQQDNGCKKCVGNKPIFLKAIY